MTIVGSSISINATVDVCVNCAVLILQFPSGKQRKRRTYEAAEPERRIEIHPGLAGDPKFDMIDGFEFAVVIKEIEKYEGRCIQNSFWQSSASKTLDEVLDSILAMAPKA
jgi:hypothetical protein